jgi:hypothetical protein
MSDPNNDNFEVVQAAEEIEDQTNVQENSTDAETSQDRWNGVQFEDAQQRLIPLSILFPNRNPNGVPLRPEGTIHVQSRFCD